MTTVSDALTVRQGRRISLLRRPKESTGFWSWFTTVDHKKIALLYTGTALIFFVIGGIEALLIRLQLAQAERQRAHGGASTTSSSPCTAPRWCSCWACRWRSRSATTSSRS